VASSTKHVAESKMAPVQVPRSIRPVSSLSQKALDTTGTVPQVTKRKSSWMIQFTLGFKPKHVAKSKMATDPRLNLAYLDLISLSVGVWKLSVSSSIAEFSFKIGEAAGKSWFS
jgi:hypothetical protein